MSNHRVDIRKESTKPSISDIEMVFGSPGSPNVGYPDIHYIDNEKSNNKDKPQSKLNGNDSYLDTNSAQPLLEPDKDPPKPPLAGPEIDDLDDDEQTRTTHSPAPYPGIDDGLLEPVDIDTHPAHDGDDDDTKKEGDGSDGHDDGVATDDGKWWTSTDVADHPYDFGSDNGLEPRFGIDGRPLSPIPSGPDVNTYQQKKNLAQGMMDLALLSANANQLRYVLEYTGAHPYYYPSIVFIALSIVLQIAVGVGLIMNSRYNVTDKEDIHKADKINNMTVLGVFLVTIVNVFITSFSVASPAGANLGSGPANVQQAG